MKKNSSEKKSKTIARLHLSQAWMDMQQKVFQAAMQGSPLVACLQPIIELIVNETHGEARAAFIIPKNGERLQLVAGMPQAYARDINEFAMEPESFALRQMIRTGEPVIIPDVELEPVWMPFLDMARKHGFRGFWSFPMRITGSPVLGSVIFYFKSPRELKPGEMKIAKILSHTAAIVISQYNEGSRHLDVGAALKQSEDRLKTILDGISEAYYALDKDWRVIFANKPALQLWEKQAEEVIGRSFLDAFPEMEGTEPYSVHQRVMASRVREHLETILPGAGRWIALDIAPTPQNGLFVTFRDIGVRKLSENALRESESKYRALFNSIDQGFVLLEIIYNEMGEAVDSRYLETNQVFKQQTGLDNWEGKTVLELFPDIEPEWLEFYSGVAHTGEPARLEYHLDQINRWYSSYASPVGGAGSPLVAVVFDDITERKQAEQRQEFLLKLSEILRKQESSEEMEQAAVQLIGKQFAVSRAFLASVNSDEGRFCIRGDYSNGLPSLTGSFAMTRFEKKWLPSWQAGKITITNDCETDSSFSATDRAICAAVGARAAISVPLIKSGRFAALLFVSQAMPRIWTEFEIKLLEETAGLIWAEVERAKAEEALRASQERLQSIANLVPDLLWDSEPDGKTNWYNQQWLDYTGQSFSEAIGWGWIDAIHPNDREGSARRYREAVEAGKPLQQEHRIRRHDGEYRWFIVNASPLKAQNGKVVKMYGAATDIHEFKKGQDTLHKREKQIRKELQDTQLLQQVSKHIIHEADQAAFYEVLLNSAMKLMSSDFASIQLLDPKTQELVLLAYKNFHPYSASHWQRVQAGPSSTCGQALATGKRVIVTDIKQHSFDMDSADYKAFRLSGIHAVQSTPLISRLGTQVGMMSTHWSKGHTPTERELGLFDIVARQVADLFERDRSMAALRESEEKYRTLFEAIDEGFSILELFFDDQGLVVDFMYLENNPAFIKQVGADLQGKKRSEIFFDQKDFLLEKYTRLVRTGEPLHFEYSVESLGGQWFQVTAARIGGKNSKHLGVIFRNITKRKHEEARQAFLLNLSDNLGMADTLKDVQSLVTESLRQHYDSGWCYYVEWDTEKEVGIVLYDSKREDLHSLAGIHDVSGVPEFLHYLKSGQILNVSDYKDYELLSLKIREKYTAAGFRSMLVASLVRKGKLISSLIIGDTKIRNWSANDEALLADVAERTWTAVERAKAEEALKRSEEKYRTLFNSIDEGFSLLELIFDDDGQVIDYWHRDDNVSFVRMTGIENPINKRMSELVPNLEPEWYQMLERVYHTGEAIRTEFSVQQLGQWYTCYLSRVGGSGSPFIAAIYDDITERKQRELNQDFLLRFSDTLRAEVTADAVAHRALKLLIDHMQLDRSYITSYYLNEDRAELDFQLGNETVPPLPDHFTLSDYPEAFRSIFDETFVVEDELKRQGLSEAEIQNSGKLGMRAMVAATLRKGNHHPLWSLVAISSSPRKWTPADIKLIEEVAERTWSAIEKIKTDEALKTAQVKYRLQLEQEVRERIAELQQSRDQLSSILNTTLVQMSILRAVRDEHGHIRDMEIKAVNHELEKETGRTDLVGKLYAKEYPGIRDAGLFDLIIKAIETGEPQTTEYFYSHEGFNKWFTCMFVKLEDGVVATNMDITARKQAEEERGKNYLLLQQSEDLAKLGSWEYDLTNKSFSWSDGMYRLFDLKKGTEITPEIYLSYTTKNGRAAAERVVQHILSGETDFVETLELKISGQIKIIHLKAAVVHDNQGKAERTLGVDMDISAMRSAEETIRKMEAEQQLEIFRVSLETLEEERHRISESLHNGIGQILYAIKINLSGFKYDQEKIEFKENKAYTSKLLTDAIIETRRISHELMPTTLDQFGLKSAIDDVCRQLSEGTRFRCHVSGSHGRLEKYLELAVYRTTQELMTNVVKHANATECQVLIAIGRKEILITVSDNGKGIETETKHKPGIGLASIRSKIKLLNGTVKVDSAPDQGTTIEISIPQPKKINYKSI